MKFTESDGIDMDNKQSPQIIESDSYLSSASENESIRPVTDGNQAQESDAESTPLSSTEAEAPDLPPCEPPEPPRKRGIVINFASMSRDVLNSMKNDVGLTMSVGCLMRLKEHFSRVERRNPSLDELYFFDSLISCRKPESDIIEEMRTSSASIAQTYSDMMAKLSALRRIDTSAPSLAEMCGIAGMYINRCGKKSSLDRFTGLFAGDDSAWRLTLDGFVPACRTSGGAVGISKSKKSPRVPTVGNLLLIISPGMEMEQAEYKKAVKHLIVADAATSFIFGSLIGKDGIAGAVCSMCNGAYIDLSVITGNSIASELSGLCDLCHGCIIAAVDQYAVNGLLNTSASFGLKTLIIGSVSSDSRLTVKHNSNAPLSVSMELIRSLSDPESRKIAINDVADFTSEDAHSDNFRVYDSATRLVLATCSGTYPASPFKALLNATLTATAQCIAGGSDYEQVGLSYSMPLCDNSISGTLAALLGAYRVQLEFYLPSYECRLVESDKYSVSAAAKISNRPVPAIFTKPGETVFLLLPRTRDDGLPDFEDIRRMWKYVAALCRDGLASSAFALGTDGVAATIEAVRGEFDFALSDDVDTSLLHAPACGGFIIESSARLQGIPIGHTTERINKDF